MRLVRLLLRTSPAMLAVAVGVSLVSGLGASALIALVSSKLTGGDPLDAQFLALFAGLLVVVTALDIVAKRVLIRLSAASNLELSLRLASQILAAPLRTLEQLGAPRLIAALTDDLGMVGNALSFWPNILVNLAILLGCILYLLWLSPLALLALGLFIVPAILGQAILHRRARRALHQASKVRDGVFVQYQLLTAGIKDLKLHRSRRAAFWDELLKPAVATYWDKVVTARTFHALSGTWGQAVFFLFVLGLFILATLTQASLAVLTGFALVALYMRGSLNTILAALPILGASTVALERLEELGFSLDAQAEAIGAAAPRPAAVTEIAMDKITHTYWSETDEDAFTLGPIDLSFRPGEIVFLTGGNGSGKTTLVKLLTGLYHPEAGALRLNGTVVEEGALESYRQLFSALFTDSPVLDRLLGIDDVDLDQSARAYLHDLQLDRKVAVSAGKLSTTDLSTGQRSRLALLLAYLEDRPVYIFDEWAAGQDPAFKAVFYHKLLPELRRRDKLVLVISHDDHYYDAADRLIKLNYGQIEFDRRQTSRVTRVESALA